jgi:emfourin
MRDGPLSVELVRTGGYTGQVVRARLDTKNLPPADAAELRRLVTAVLAASPAPRRTGPPIPDAMHYRLDIATGGQRRTVEVSDPDVPAEVRALISQLLTIGR